MYVGANNPQPKSYNVCLNLSLSVGGTWGFNL